MRIIKLLGFAVVLSLPTFADAATWERVLNTPTLIISFDTDSIAREGSKVKIWTWWTYASVQQGGFNNDKVHDLYDCAEHTVKTLSWTTYLNEQVVGRGF